MKKFLLIGLCMLSAAAASAQVSLVKDVERQMKSKIEDYPKILPLLQPAFTDPETAEDAYVWFVAGKGGVDFFDKQQVLYRMGKEVDIPRMSHALLNSYDYLINAIQRDTIVDAKGKLKTKYSKDAAKLIKGHYNDFSEAGNYLYNAKDFNGAYDAWDLYTRIPLEKSLGNEAPEALPDSILGNVYFNMGICAWQAEDYNKAMGAFDKCIGTGYHKQEVFDYAISVAANAGNNEKIVEYCSLALPIYNSSKYIRPIAIDMVNNEKYADGIKVLEDYLAGNPNDVEMIVLQGQLYEASDGENPTEENSNKALSLYKRALELNPNDQAALYNYGRVFYNKAQVIHNSDSVESYNNSRTNEVKPLYEEAIKYLEQAYAVDEYSDLARKILQTLRTAYYNINDEANFNRVSGILGIAD